MSRDGRNTGWWPRLFGRRPEPGWTWDNYDACVDPEAPLVTEVQDTRDWLREERLRTNRGADLPRREPAGEVLPSLVPDEAMRLRRTGWRYDG